MSSPLLRLFFALRPPPESARQIAAAVRTLDPPPRVRWLKPANYHVTVHFLGNHAGDFPEGLLDCARRAAEAVRITPFAIALDRLDCFRTREPAPLILRPDAASEASLQDLWRRLTSALARHGQDHHDGRDFTPHLTIGYGAPLPATPIAPIAWTADAFELIVSHAGEGRHEAIARWPMTP